MFSLTKVTLTEEQKAEVAEIYKSTPDLIVITRKVFKNEELDGRSKEGRAVRQFLTTAGLKYRTTDLTTTDLILTEDQKKFILQNAESMTAFEMAKVLFPNSTIISTLNKEPRTIIDFLREEAPEKLQKSENGVGLEYRAPATIAEAAAVVNRYAGIELKVERLSAQNRQCLTSFIRFINSYRLVQIINSFNDKDDRELFEAEFTRFTWDKPDLTADEVTLYINICQDIIHNRRLGRHMEKLNKSFENANDDEFTIKLSEAMKAKTDEYDKVQKRIESLIKKLNGDRANRLAKQGERTANFLALVEAFQMEDDRKRFLIIAKASREKVKNEADRIEGLEEFKARILGISKAEVL